MKKVTLIADGACKKNPGAGGWAFLLRYGDFQREYSGGEKLSTNNRMELTAVIEGLKALKERVSVTIITDSQYITKAFTEGRVKKWVGNGWQTNTGAVKNQDLWKILVPLVEKHDVTWQWIKGHTGDPDHDIVDKLASDQALLFKNVD